MDARYESDLQHFSNCCAHNLHATIAAPKSGCPCQQCRCLTHVAAFRIIRPHHYFMMAGMAAYLRNDVDNAGDIVEVTAQSGSQRDRPVKFGTNI